MKVFKNKSSFWKNSLTMITKVKKQIIDSHLMLSRFNIELAVMIYKALS